MKQPRWAQNAVPLQKNKPQTSLAASLQKTKHGLFGSRGTACRALLITFTLFLCIIASCASDSLTTDGSDLGSEDIVEAGNPPSPKKRTLVGDVSPSSGTTCVADVVQAYDAGSTILSGTVQEDCSFVISVMTGKVWGVRLVKNSDVSATLKFNNGTGLTGQSTYYTSNEDYDVDLGTISVSGTSATPANEPAKQNDRDGDGQLDYDDTDDDGDGVLDVNEADCDEDGIVDDDDLDSTCSE